MIYKLLLKKKGVPGFILEYEGPNRQTALDGFSFYSDPDNGYVGAHIHRVHSDTDTSIFRTTSSPDGKGDSIF